MQRYYPRLPSFNQAISSLETWLFLSFHRLSSNLHCSWYLISTFRSLLFIFKDMADRKSDWISGKITIPVILGDDKTAILHAFTMCLAYVSIPVLWTFTTISIWTLLALMLTGLPVIFITRSLNTTHRPYRLDPFVARSLQHAPLVLIILFFDRFLQELMMAPWYHVMSLSFQIRCLPIYPYLYSLLRAPTKYIEHSRCCIGK